MSSSASSSAGTASSNGQPIDPLTRNALRYSLSPREYKLLHKYLIAKAPAVKKRAPPPHKYEKSVKDTGDYNAAAIRASLRVFGTTLAGLKLWDLITVKVLSRGKELPCAQPSSVSKAQADQEAGRSRKCRSIDLRTCDCLPRCH